MPPTLRGWRVDLPPEGQALFDRLYVEGYTFENSPDGSLFAHAPNGGVGMPPSTHRAVVAPQRFNHANWAAYGATPEQSIQIQNNRMVALGEQQTDLRRVLGEFGWVYARQGDGIIMALPGTSRDMGLGTLADMTMPPPLRGVGGVEVLFNWTTGQMPQPLPLGSRVEVRWRDATYGSVMESRVVRDWPQPVRDVTLLTPQVLQAPIFPTEFRAQYQPLLSEQRIGWRPVDGALTPYGETTEGRQALERELQQAARAMDISRALNEDRAAVRPDRGPRTSRDTAAQGSIPPDDTPEFRRNHATAWLTNELRRRSNDPLQQDRKAFMVWAAEVYGEFMRRRDGEGNVDLRQNIPSQ